MEQHDLAIKEGAKLFKSVSDPSRIRILNLLFHIGEMCISDLEQVLEFTQTKTSRHLIYLKNADLTDNRKMEQWSFYFLKKESKALVGALLELLQSDEQLQKDLEVYRVMLSNRALAVSKLENRSYLGEEQLR